VPQSTSSRCLHSSFNRKLSFVSSHVYVLMDFLSLIRPGHVDKKLLLGYMAAADIICMLEHYFQTTLNSSQVARVEEVVNGNSTKPASSTPILKLTPAQLEQMAVEHDELSDMIAALEKMSPLFASKPKKSFAIISKASFDRHRSR
jgi:hypothetical protein